MLRGARLRRPKFPLLLLLAGAKEVPRTQLAQPRSSCPQKASLRVHRAVAGGRHLVLVAPCHPVPGTCCSRASLSDFPGTIQREAVANPRAVLMFPSFKDGRLLRQFPHQPSFPRHPPCPVTLAKGVNPRVG